MVLAEMWLERRVRKARQEHHAKWESRLQRSRDAESKGIPFDEPYPQPDDQRNRRSRKA